MLAQQGEDNSKKGGLSSGSRFQQTLASSLERSGVGLHLGQLTRVKISPADPGQGRYFVRTDLPDQPIIPAQVEAVSQTTLSTELADGDNRVRTVEHLLAALAGMGVDNARIEINGPEAPLLDGSAQSWVEGITAVGIAAQNVERVVRSLKAPVLVQQGDAFVTALPAPEIRFSYGIDFDLPAIGNQWHSWSPSQTSHSERDFAAQIAPARTFGLADQIEYLRANGLIKGGSLDNALVCSQSGWLNPPLRFPNEPVRHKLLDLVGDLSLLGALSNMHVLAYKASHHLHIQLAKKINAGFVD